MDATRVTEQPTSFERPEAGADPADGRGALTHAPEPVGTPVLPVQARADGTPSGPGTATSCGQPMDGKGKEPPVNGPEHSQPATADAGRSGAPYRAGSAAGAADAHAA